MTGKEHPLNNSGAAVRGIAPAEKVEVEEEEFKVGAVPCADLMYGGLRSCAGGHKPTEEEEVKADGMSGGLEEDVAGAVDDSEGEATEEWMEMPMDYLAWILSKTKEEKYVPPIEEVRNPELPQDEINRRNELYRKINERVQVANSEFFRLQSWVRDTLERNGRVMIPADTFDPAPQVQEEIDQIWRDVMNEYGVDITKLP